MPGSPDRETPFVLARVSIARVARHTAWFAARLDARDRARAGALSVDKRRVDFVAGRAAAGRALRRLGITAPIEIDEGARAGAPIVRGGWLSITHGAGWGIAVASVSGPVGVDVERVEPRHPAFASEAFAPGELDAWSSFAGGEPAATVTLAWCAKEAWLKVRGDGLRAVLTEVAIEPLARHDDHTIVARAGRDALVLHVERRGDVLLVVARPTCADIVTFECAPPIP